MTRGIARPEGFVEDDQVNHPAHYNVFPFETKDIIDSILTTYRDDLSPYQAYCLGNELKYRLRAGFKNPDKIEQDIKKALFYYNERKGLDNP